LVSESQASILPFFMSFSSINEFITREYNNLQDSFIKISGNSNKPQPNNNIIYKLQENDSNFGIFLNKFTVYTPEDAITLNEFFNQDLYCIPVEELCAFNKHNNYSLTPENSTILKHLKTSISFINLEYFLTYFTPYCFDPSEKSQDCMIFDYEIVNDLGAEILESMRLSESDIALLAEKDSIIELLLRVESRSILMFADDILHEYFNFNFPETENQQYHQFLNEIDFSISNNVFLELCANPENYT